MRIMLNYLILFWLAGTPRKICNLFLLRTDCFRVWAQFLSILREYLKKLDFIIFLKQYFYFLYIIYIDRAKLNSVFLGEAPDNFLYITRLNLPMTISLHCNWYGHKILCIHSVAWYCKIYSQRYHILWKYGDKARIAPIIDSNLARPWHMYDSKYIKILLILLFLTQTPGYISLIVKVH